MDSYYQRFEGIRKLSPAVGNIKTILAANRGDAAIRVFRAANELGLKTVAIYSYEDRLAIHRYKADEAYCVGRGLTPVGAYLAMDEIIKIAKENKVDAIHPGYGFLSENSEFATKVKEAGIVWIGPAADIIKTMGDKTEARNMAIKAGVPVVPGSGIITKIEDLNAFVEKNGFPVIIKAAMGGGGRGMRVVRVNTELEESFHRASSEAKAAFGDGSVFVEKFLEKPRHIEIQVLGDLHGNLVHLYERDCSVQRRHQKVIEIAPALNLDPKTRDKLGEAAINLCKAIKYTNAGTVEFLLDSEDNFYFMEMNPRLQVEHTVTEEVTGIDIVQTQILIAEGATLPDLKIIQDKITLNGFAVQCRVTTEDPENNFQPQSGRIAAYRSSAGPGIRLDGSSGYTNSIITPYYDSLLVKITAHSTYFEATIRKLLRALTEIRIRGVVTNIEFLQKILIHPDFLAGKIFTQFIDQTPELFIYNKPKDRAQKMLSYLAEVKVNGCPLIDLDKQNKHDLNNINNNNDFFINPKNIENYKKISNNPDFGWKYILDKEGPEAFCKKIREYSGLLLTDTTFRDAHQSLLATRMRTIDMATISPLTSILFNKLFSIEMWGGATFDVCLRFLRECPWERLKQLRKLIPNVPFQMLIRGVNAVGYTSYPDNVIFEFVKKAKNCGIDIFRIFDSLNYLDNLKLGIEAVKQAGGIIEACMCYTGDISNTNLKSKYDLKYYLNLADDLVKLGIHILAIKDMAGLLTPQSAHLLISSLRSKYPNLPIHVHTHDTAGTGVASMVAAAKAGADIVDVAIDSMSGMTSQPSMGAVVAATNNSDINTFINLEDVQVINDYWESTRLIYAPFESGLKSGSSDVYLHEMPGGQFTNLQFQAKSLGLTGKWLEIKKAYREANLFLGDLIKVTPSSKVVGDLAQFMVQNNFTTSEALRAQASTLSFPSSVVQYFQGHLGQPYGGFDQDLRKLIVKDLPLMDERPGKTLPPADLISLKKELESKFEDLKISDEDVLSYVLFPQVFEEFAQWKVKYSDLSILPTKHFLQSLSLNSEVELHLSKGLTLYIKLLAVGPTAADGTKQVFFEMNGSGRVITVEDVRASEVVVSQKVRRNKVDKKDLGSIGAPMSGVVMEIRVSEGHEVKAGDPLVVLSAMKMEMIVSAPKAGIVGPIEVDIGDSIAADDLLVTIKDKQQHVDKPVYGPYAGIKD